MAKGEEQYTKKLKSKLVNIAENEKDLMSNVRTKSRPELGRRFREERIMGLLRAICKRHAGNATINEDDLTKAFKLNWKSITDRIKKLGFEVHRVRDENDEHWLVIDRKEKHAPKRGRPRKTTNEVEPTATPRKRGRPRKVVIDQIETEESLSSASDFDEKEELRLLGEVPADV